MEGKGWERPRGGTSTHVRIRRGRRSLQARDHVVQVHETCSLLLRVLLSASTGRLL